MTDKRYWIGGGAVAALLILVAGWFALISPELSSASSLRSQTTSTEDQNTHLQSKLATLKRQSDNLSQLTADMQAALEALPVDTGLPALTRQLSSQAVDNHVSLTSIAVGSIGATSGTGAAPAAGAPTTGTPTTTAPATSLYAVPVTLLSTGRASDQLAFMQAIREQGPRRALITAAQLAPATGSSVASIDTSSTLTLQLTVFTAPQTAH